MLTPKENLLEALKFEKGRPECLPNDWTMCRGIAGDPIFKLVRGNRIRGTESFDQWGTKILFPEDAPMDEKVQKILEFMEGLTEAQRDLVYDHLGAWKYLEDVRREEEARTGKAVTQQAISNRWNKIITKGCKDFGVEKPRKRKK